MSRSKKFYFDEMSYIKLTIYISEYIDRKLIDQPLNVHQVPIKL